MMRAGDETLHILKPRRDAKGKPLNVSVFHVSVTERLPGHREGDMRLRLSTLSKEEAVHHAQGIHKREGTIPDIIEVERTPIDHPASEHATLTQGT